MITFLSSRTGWEYADGLSVLKGCWPLTNILLLAQSKISIDIIIDICFTDVLNTRQTYINV